MHPCQKDSRSFFEKLQKADGLDLRDVRGKKHDLAVILMGVTLAVLSNRDGNLSSIYRHLVNHYKKLMRVVGEAPRRPVSRAQLPRILEKVSVQVFDNLIVAHFGRHLSEKEQQWFAIDGKELRGSIASGEKRGLALVQAVAHETGRSVAQNYYCGQKESEKTRVREVLRQRQLASQKVTLDALHCNWKTLELIAAARGKYLVGLKNNQKKLLEQVIKQINGQAILYQWIETEKGHGRIEQREYEISDVLEMKSASRFKACQIRTAIKVRRETEHLKSAKKSVTVSYYLSNEVGRYEELVRAIRRHWQVEVNNYRRDVTLKEDGLRTKKSGYTGDG